MRQLSGTGVAIVCLVLAASSARAIEFNLAVSVNGGAPVRSGGDLGRLVLGDVLDVELFVDNPQRESFWGISVSLLFDSSVYDVRGRSTRVQVPVGAGSTPTPVLAERCGFLGLCFLQNLSDPLRKPDGTWLSSKRFPDSTASARLARVRSRTPTSSPSHVPTRRSGSWSRAQGTPTSPRGSHLATCSSVCETATYSKSAPTWRTSAP